MLHAANPSAPGTNIAGADQQSSDRGAMAAQQWAARLDMDGLVALEETVIELSDLAQHQDDADAHLLNELMMLDPLATIWALSQRAPTLRADMAGMTTTITAVVLRLGIGRFFERVAGAQSVESLLVTRPQQWDALDRRIRRVQRTANLTVAIAAHRMDPSAPALHSAAVLQHWGALWLWLYEPQAIAQWDALEPGRVTDPQTETHELGCTLAQLSSALMVRHDIADSLRIAADESQASRLTASRTIALAHRLAIAVECGWDSEEVYAALEPIADFLGIDVLAARDQLTGIA